MAGTVTCKPSVTTQTPPLSIRVGNGDGCNRNFIRIVDGDFAAHGPSRYRCIVGQSDHVVVEGGHAAGDLDERVIHALVDQPFVEAVSGAVAVLETVRSLL